MAIEIKMPQLSDTMDSGKILTWNKQEGDQIDRGDILAEVETDKANLEIESFHQGTLLKILTGADQTAQVGEVIAVIGEAGEEVTTSSSSDTSDTEEESKTDEQQSAPKESANAKQPDSEDSEKQESEDEPHTKHSNSNGNLQADRAVGEDSRIKASPLAKKIASQKNIDLHSVTGSGPDGRIVKRDIESFVPTSNKEEPEDSQPTSVRKPSSPKSTDQKSSATSSGTLTPLNKMRQTIARRMQKSVVESPHFYVSTSIEMNEVVKLRTVLKESESYAGLSFNHFIIMAVAYALRHEPGVNYAYREPQQLFDPGELNIGIITSVEGGLIIPVLHNVQNMNLQDIVLEAKAVLDRVRAGRPQSKDLTGGTFSISNLGMFDVENFTALINPGQGSVLAVGGILEQPWVKDGQIVPAKIMKVTLSVDHRVIDGVIGANFLKHFKQGLECPALLMSQA